MNATDIGHTAITGIVKATHQSVTKPEKKAEKAASTEKLPPGQKRKETEGVFVIRDGTSVFTPVKTGIAGDKYFEVLSGLTEGDQVITGPISSVRDLADGTEVKRDETATGNTDTAAKKSGGTAEKK